MQRDPAFAAAALRNMARLPAALSAGAPDISEREDRDQRDCEREEPLHKISPFERTTQVPSKWCNFPRRTTPDKTSGGNIAADEEKVHAAARQRAGKKVRIIHVDHPRRSSASRTG